MAKQIHQLTTASSVGASDYLAKDTGSVTNKVTISQIANFVVGTYTTLVAGATQTIKSAINAVKTQLTTLQNHTGLTSISGSGKSTISELLGNTSISSIGNGTVTGAISSLNSNLAQLSQMIYTKTFSCENISITAGTAGTRGGQKTVDVAVSGYTPIAVGLTQVNDSSLANVVPFFGSNGNPNTVFVNAYRASGSAGTVSGIYFRVIYLKS